MLLSGKIRQLLLALVATLFVWVVHTLSLEYSSSMQFSVRVSSDMVGYEVSSVSDEPLLLHGSATGFRLMRIRRLDGNPDILDITVDAKYLSPVGNDGTSFLVKVPDVRDKIVEALGDKVSVDFFDTENLTFTFRRQDYKKVPVTATASVTYRTQYMPVREISLAPDSVLVYGDVTELEGINEIHTNTIFHRGVNKNVQGYVDLDKRSVGSLRLSEDKVLYTIYAERYVEATKSIDLQVRNLPAGESVILLPSKVDVTYRFPFDVSSRSYPDLNFYVDYADCAAAAGTKVIPRPDFSSDRIYSYSLKPAMVEFIVEDER